MADADDVIEYSPDSPSVCAIEAQPPIIIYVCSLCLRQYDLIEDLRGHMIMFHGCVPFKKSREQLSSSESGQSDTSGTEELGDDNDNTEDTEDESYVELHLTAEMRPLPFKDFRMLLRAHMQKRCCVNSNCIYKFENQIKLELHVKCHKQQSADKGFTCYKCGNDFINWRRCSTHLWKTHQINVDMLKCPICNYQSHESVLVWRHMRVHEKWRPRVLRSMRSVLRRRHQIQQKQKATTVATTATGTAPIVRPNKNKYYAEKTCEICSRAFVNGKTLSKHVKTVHNKIKPFICSVCGKKTARKASLIIHMRQHTGEKPLQCKTCKFSTRDPSVLHKHRLRHERQGKLKCEHCNYVCIQASAYKRHVRLNHPAEFLKIACDMCNYTTINVQKLHAHKEDHRKGLLTNCEDSMDASRVGAFKYPRKLNDKSSEISADCFMPLESIDSLPHEPAVDTGGVTIPAPSEDTQFPTYFRETFEQRPNQ